MGLFSEPDARGNNGNETVETEVPMGFQPTDFRFDAAGLQPRLIHTDYGLSSFTGNMSRNTFTFSPAEPRNP
jgi:hypothetical protein